MIRTGSTKRIGKSGLNFPSKWVWIINEVLTMSYLCGLKRPLSSRQWKNKNIFVGIPPCCAAGWNFSRGAMELHRCHAFEPLLVASVVIEIEVILNLWNKIVSRSEFSQVIHLGFDDSPEALHRTVVNASSDTWHTLSHIRLNKFVVKNFACVLKSPVPLILNST